jgi:glycosyltransferase involved in cell wall biosynthesis
MPRSLGFPTVVTVHDLTFFDHPEWHERTKVPVFRRAIRHASRHAAAIVCVSQATADRLQVLCPPRGRVFVIPHGVDHGRFRPAGEHDAAPDAAVLARRGLAGPYILFVGTLEPRKAVPTLIAAFDAVAPRYPEVTLVLAGRPGWGAAAVSDALDRSVHRDRIVVTGYLPDAEVPVLLRHAAVVAYPAFEEGFGLPALEALACGSLLVTTKGTPMAELAGSVAWLAAPGNVDELAEGVRAALEEKGAVARREEGQRIAARYTWAAAAAGHCAAYRWAAEHPSGSRASDDR